MQTYEIINNLLKLTKESKFEPDDSLHYPGIERLEIQNELIALVNQIIDEFINYVNEKANDFEYQELIKKSLSKFNQYTLDTEDKERVCTYIVKIMDIINLESSGGYINEWLYGFKI